jgi:uncharacterized protein DUF4912
MEDLKKLSVERLRELARKHLGKGHSRLRTRAQLLEALKGVMREPLSRLLEAAESVSDRVRVLDFPPGRRGRVRARHTAAEKTPPEPATPASRKRRASPRAAAAAVSEPVPAEPARERTVRPRVRAGQLEATPDRGARAGARRGDGAARVEPAPPVAEAPVEEAFFETPAAPRRPRRVPAPSEPLEAEPFPSPREVGTDAPLLLVRDPTTLFIFWDFRRELERGAALGLREPRLLLRLYRGEDLDRSLELSLGARSTYVTGLTSGQEYTAEVLLLGRDGWTRPVGSRSGPRRLPPGRVSRQLEVRTLRLPWTEPLGQVPAPSAPSPARHEPLDSPRRVPLPTSPGGRGPKGGPGPSGGPRSGRN